MLLGAIKITFLVTVAALVVDVGTVDGIAEYAIGVVLVLCAVALFNAGCRVAAGIAAEQAYDQGEKKGARDALMRVRHRALADLATGDLPPPEAR